MSDIEAVGAAFLGALQRRDFPGLEACFQPTVRVRSLVPSGFREVVGTTEATGLFHSWFGDAEELLVISQRVDVLVRRLVLTYCLRVRKSGEWQVVQQDAFGTVQDGKIGTLDVLCSGFHAIETGHADEASDAAAATTSAGTNEPLPRPDAVLDAPDQGCITLTPLIRTRMRELQSGQILEVRTDDPTAEENLGAWSRLTGHALVRIVEDGPDSRRFFIRKR